MRVAYVYFMSDDPDRVRAVAPQHAAYWHSLTLPAYLGGRFADRSGGLITFEAESIDDNGWWKAIPSRDTDFFNDAGSSNGFPTRTHQQCTVREQRHTDVHVLRPLGYRERSDQSTRLVYRAQASGRDTPRKVAR